MLMQHSKTYYKYLLSYVALLLAAVLALLLFSQAFFVTELKDSLLEAHRSRLRQTARQLDTDIQQIYTIDYQISSANANFLSYYLESPSPMRDLRLVNEFRNLLVPSTLIAEMALVEADSNDVYTSTAVYARSLFFDSIFSFENWDDPVGDLAALKGRIVRPAERINGTDRYITFINAPSVFSRLQDAVLMFFIREEHFLNSLSPESAPSQQGAIWNSQGRVIVSTLPLTAPVEGDRLSYGDESYIVLCEPSEVMDWTYAFFLPTTETFTPIYRAQVILAVFLLVLIAAGTLLIRYAMRLNYRPIQELTEALGRSDNDDLESLRDAIGSLSAQNENMRAQLMCSPDGQALKDSLLFSLLKGKFDSFEAFNHEAVPLKMTFNKPCYQVLMLRLFEQENELPRQTLAEALAESLGEDFIWFFRDLFEHSMFVCLVGMEEGADATLARCCLRLLDVCAEKHGLTFSIGASNTYSDIAHISTACFEATQAVREHFIRGRHQLIPYSSLSRTLTSQFDHLGILSHFSEMTPQQQMQAIRRFVDSLKEQNIPALLAKSFCNRAAQIVISSASTPVSMDDLFTISYLRTVDDYLDFMLRVLEGNQAAAEPECSAAKADMTELLQRIYAYITANFDDCNFSLQGAADNLNMSSSYLSQYFKQQTGDTLTGYVASLRIQKACTLLKTTTMPVQMVSESVGYYNQNSFIRRFKQMTGVTPGEYRRVHQ